MVLSARPSSARDISPLYGKIFDYSLVGKDGYELIPPDISSSGFYFKMMNHTFDWNITISPYSDQYLNTERILYYDREVGAYTSIKIPNLIMRSVNSLRYDFVMAKEHQPSVALYNFGYLVLAEIVVSYDSKINPEIDQLIDLLHNFSWIHRFRPWVGLIIKLELGDCQTDHSLYQMVKIFLKDYHEWYDFALIKGNKHRCISYDAYEITDKTKWEIEVYNLTMNLGIWYQDNYKYHRKWTGSLIWSYICEYVFMRIF